MEKNKKLDLSSIMLKTHAYEKRKLGLVEMILNLEKESENCALQQGQTESASEERNASSSNSSIPDSHVEEAKPSEMGEEPCPLEKTRSRTGSNETALPSTED